MKPNGDQPKAPESKPESKPKSRTEVGSKPRMSERRFENPSYAGSGEEIGVVAERPQPSRGTETLGAIRAERDRGKENQRIPEVPQLFLGPHSVDDRSGGDSVGGGPALAGFLHHSLSALLQRCGGILGGTSGRQRNCCVEGQTRDQGHGETRWKVGQPCGARTGAGRRHPSAAGRHRAGGCAFVGGRSGASRSVRVNRRIFARHRQTWRGRVFGFDYQAGRNRRDGIRHRYAHLLRQDCGTGAGRSYRQPFPACRAEDWQLPDHPRSGPGGGDCRRRALPSRSCPQYVGVRPGTSGGRDPRGHAHRAICDHGSRCAPAGQKSKRL